MMFKILETVYLSIEEEEKFKLRNWRDQKICSNVIYHEINFYLVKRHHN